MINKCSFFKVFIIILNFNNLFIFTANEDPINFQNQIKDAYFQKRSTLQIFSLTFDLSLKDNNYNHLVFNKKNIDGFEALKKTLKYSVFGKFEGAELPIGYILHGPPGNGKREWVYKLASEVDATIIYFNATGILTPSYRFTCMLMRDLFNTAYLQHLYTNKKLFLVIDNFEVLANSEYDYSYLDDLKMMFELSEKMNFKDFFIFGITKNYSDIDTTIFSSARGFDSFYFKNPEEPTIKKLLKLLLAKYPTSNKVLLENLAVSLQDQSASKIKQIFNTAFLESKKENLSTITNEVLNETIKKHTSTPESNLNNETGTEANESETIDLGSGLTASLWKKGTVETRFEDVISNCKIKEEVSDILLFINEPERFEKTKAKVPNGIILYGPTGTGKTLFAKALAGEAGCSFISINSALLTSKYMGDSAKNIKNLFKYARKIAKIDRRPCILFFDEVDSFTIKRGSSYGCISDDNRQMINQFLCELDGFEKKHGEIIVVAATNRLCDIDEAVLRPGRIDRHICIELPSFELRKQIFERYASSFTFSPDIDLAKSARETVYFSGAEIKNMINEAAIYAAKENSPVIKQSNMNEAYLKISLGVENRSLGMSATDIKTTAYHESGHALLALYTKGKPLLQVTCIPRGHALGVTMTGDEKEDYNVTREKLFASIAMSYGGMIAEEIINNNKHSAGISSDLKQATNTATKMVCDFGMSSLGHIYISERIRDSDKRVKDAVIEILKEAEVYAREILNSKLDELHLLATTLIDRETMSGEEVKELLATIKK